VCHFVYVIVCAGTMLAQDRPGFDFDQLTWADHKCRIYEVPAPHAVHSSQWCMAARAAWHF
jgi:hypothetical protein